MSLSCTRKEDYGLGLLYLPHRELALRMDYTRQPLTSSPLSLWAVDHRLPHFLCLIPDQLLKPLEFGSLSANRHADWYALLHKAELRSKRESKQDPEPCPRW